MREQNRPGGLSLINPPGLYDPAPNGYSHVALLPPGARLAFIAGQGGETADGQLSEDFRQQVRQALRNLCIAIEAVGGTPQQIARLGVLIVDHSEARLQVALAGLGITCLPHFTAAQALAEGRLREVLPQWRYTGSYQGAAWLLWRQNHHLPPKTRALIDYLSEALIAS